MIRRTVLLFAITGCSLLVSLDDLGGGSDAALDAMPEAAPEAGPDAAATCDPSKPFTTFRPLAELASKGDDNHATLSPDELQIWFGTDRFSDANKRDIYTAKRKLRTDPFGSITLVDGLSTPNDEGQPSISPDLETMLFAMKVNNVQWDVFIATRPDAGNTWGVPAQVVVVNGSANDWMATFSADQKTLYFSSDRGGDSNVWSWAYGSPDSPAQVGGINTTYSDQRQCVSNDELVIYWSSNRPDLGHVGGLDIFVATRARKTDAFSNARIVGELSTNADENPDWLSPDLCRLYVHSNRSSSAGGDDLYVAERAP